MLILARKVLPLMVIIKQKNILFFSKNMNENN